MAKNDPKPFPDLTQEQIERFLASVNCKPGQGPNGDCWEFIGTRDKRSGYGRFFYTIGIKREAGAHRIAKWIETRIHPEPLLVLHACDNPACARPSHLFYGTQADNVRDCMAKGRNAKGDMVGSRKYPERYRGKTKGKGEKNNNAKMNETLIKAMRATYAEGLITNKRRLGRIFAIHHVQVARILNRDLWK